MRLQYKFNLPPLLLLSPLNWACPYHAYSKYGFAESVKHFEEKGTTKATSLCKCGETCAVTLHGLYGPLQT